MYIDNDKLTIIYTDHESLKYLQIMKNPLKHLAQWISEFSDFNLNIKHCQNSETIVSDIISQYSDLMKITLDN